MNFMRTMLLCSLLLTAPFGQNERKPVGGFLPVAFFR